MHSTPASTEVFQWVRRAAISAVFLVFITGTAAAQYQSVPWDDPVGGGSGSTGSPPEQDQKEEEKDERNVAAQVSITIDQRYVPVPARGEPAASVSVMVRAMGTKGSLAGARVRLEVVGPASSFVSTPGGFSMEQPVLNGSGAWGTTLYVSNPTMLDLGAFPTTVQLRVALSDDKGSLGGTSQSFPLGIILIHGATVGPTDPKNAPLVLKGRQEPAPSVNWLKGFIHSTSRANGQFFVLLRVPKKDLKLKILWPDDKACHLPLQYPLDLPPAVNPNLILPAPVELLSPEEHQNRIKAFVKEFVDSMPLTASARSHLLSRMTSLPFKTGSSSNVPAYTSSTTNTLGAISLPGKPGAYWANNLVDVSEGRTDPAYAITFHEMGHFVHQQLIESFRWKMFYNIDKYLGSAHSTWSAPDTWFDSAKNIVSFNESTADFFAYLMYIFVEQRHPEFKRSTYYHRSYLAEFDTSAKARSVASKKGCMIEGVQTSYLRALYGDRVQSAPALVYADYLRIMLQYEDDSWIIRFIPARTISEWINTKSRHQTLGTTAKPKELARQFNIMPCDTQPQILINSTRTTGSYVVNGRRIDATGSSTVGSLLIGDEVTINSGKFVISTVNPSSDQFTVITAPAGATFRLVSANEVYVSKGLIAVKGPATISSPSGKFTPQGTAWTVEVAESGDATVKVFEGSVLVENSKERATVVQGNTATVRKKKIQRTTFNPADPLLTSIFALSGGASLITDAPLPVPAPVTSPVAAPPVAAPVSQPAGLVFYSIRQGATGQCVVVAGTEGISAGDTVYGAFPDFQQAQAAVQSMCLAGQSAVPPAAASPVSPVNPTAPSQPMPPAATTSLFASPVLAVPKFDNDDSTKGIFFIGLDNGNAFFIDKVKSSPQTVRTRALNQNIFELLERQPGEAARFGQVLVGPVRKGNGMVHALFLVDTTTGVMGYITDLENRSYEGRMKRVNGAPAATLASDDGNFALVMHQNSSGATDGAILYHGTTGKSAFISGIDAPAAGLRVLQTTPLTPTGGGVSSLEILAGSEATDALLLIDPVNGSMRRVGINKKKAGNFEVSTLKPNLFDVFPRDTAVQTPHRFVIVPITSGSGATVRALIVDVGSGTIAHIDNVRNTKKMSLKLSSQNIYSRLRKDVARPRVITAVPKVASSGATEGAWLFDSVTGTILFLDGLADPGSIRILKVEELVR